MAALTITAANVLAAADAPLRIVTAGATITAGMALYRDSADGKYKKARGNAAGTAAVDGIAVSGGADNQPILIVEPAAGGNINLGATLVVGETYCLSDAVAGEIVPIGDLGSGDFPVIIGQATSASNLLMRLVDSNIAKA